MLFRKIPSLLSYSLIVLGSSFLSAQDTASSVGTSGTTIVNVSVTDRKHHPLTGLKAENFSVSEEGQRRQIISVSTDLPACVGLIVDHSGSMRQKLPTFDTALGDFVRVGNPENRVFVANFNDNVYLDQDFTNDPHLIEAALGFRPGRGGTALYDAVAGAARHLAQARDCKRNVLVIVSDGDENESRIKLEQLQTVIQKTGKPVIYAITLSERNDSHADRGRRALKAITDATGGEAVPGDKDIRQSCLRVAEEIRNTYSVSYASGDPASGDSGVKVEVRAPDVKDPVVRTQVPTSVDLAALTPPDVRTSQRSAASPADSMSTGSAPSRIDSRGLTNCIGGAVLDEHNMPVAGITVQALPMSKTGSNAGALYPTTVTDEHGKFRLTRLEKGSYILLTANPSAGYPPTTNQLYRNHPTEIAAASRNCGTTYVRVGPKAATLRVVAVDALSGAQIAHFGISVENEAHASVDFTDAQPEQAILVPANATLKVSVWSRGYARSRPIPVKSPSPETSQEVMVPLDTRN